jgi:hypothetical protein
MATLSSRALLGFLLLPEACNIHTNRHVSPFQVRKHLARRSHAVARASLGATVARAVAVADAHLGHLFDVRLVHGVGFYPLHQIRLASTRADACCTVTGSSPQRQQPCNSQFSTSRRALPKLRQISASSLTRRFERSMARCCLGLRAAGRTRARGIRYHS